MNKWYEANQEMVKERERLRYKNNKEQIRQKGKLHYEQNRDKILAHQKCYCEQNKEKVKAAVDNWFINHRDKTKEYYKNYYQKNKKSIHARNKKRLETDPLYALKDRLRHLVSGTFKRIAQNKPTNTEKLLGCTWLEAKAYFESKFQPGMDWSNIKDWRVHHIRPVATFTESDIDQMNYYTNLQPLWIEDHKAVHRSQTDDPLSRPTSGYLE